jgi:hypothetical protein
MPGKRYKFRPITRRTKYKFLHRAGGYYYWRAVVPIDSRYEHVKCKVDWFWRMDR